ncbi:MAG: hypothetical protein P1U37_05775 [Minwuia sp.]|nr:hypothetical protein [Minwuia sp.]
MRILAPIATSLALALAACGGVGTAADGSCPRIGVLQDAANFPLKDSAGNIRALARLSFSRATPCTYNKSSTDQTGFSSMRTVLNVRADAARAESASMSSIEVPVIVATVSADGLLTGRHRLTMDVPFTTGGTGNAEEQVEVVISYKGSGEAEQHRIVIAFDLDRDEVLLNRSRVGR